MFVIASNIAFLGYLYIYTNGGGKGQFLFGLPEVFVVLVGFVFVVTLINAALAWYYLGKPDVAELYTPEDSAADQDLETDTEGI